MSQNSAKKHFYRTKNQVNKHYILSPDEIKTEKQTRYLFEKFDTDKSGGLDNEELESLFREFHIEVDANMINHMFGANMHFNLDNFLRMNHSKKQLQTFHRAMKKVQHALLIRAGSRRRYVPTTFDETMVNLGYHAERKEIRDNIDKLDAEMDRDLQSLSTE